MGHFFVDCMIGEHLDDVLQTLYKGKNTQCADILVNNDEEVAI